MHKALIAGTASAAALLAGCGGGGSVIASGTAAPTTRSAIGAAPSNAPPTVVATLPPTTVPPTTVPPTTVPPTTVPPTTVPPTTTTRPCALSVTPGSAETIPVDDVCSAVGAPHFATPATAMAYLATAWNTDDVQELDYVTNPAGRAEMDAMAAEMVDLQFSSCTANPAGDYTCYFHHDIRPSTSPTTYPNPMGFPPGEAVFTVAPATGPGWYLTNVVHCG